MYDSMWRAGRIRLAAQFVVPYLNFLLDLREGEWEINESGTSSPQQTNSFDCGIFVIHTILCFLKEEPVTHPPLNFRNTVLRWILD